MVIKNNELFAIAEKELFADWLKDEVIQKSMDYSEYVSRLKNNGVTVFEFEKE